MVPVDRAMKDGKKLSRRHEDEAPLMSIASVTLMSALALGLMGVMTANAAPAMQEKILYAFTGGNDGGTPNALIQAGGILYGTTESGGSTTADQCAVYFGCGTVFSVTPGGVEKTLHVFTGAPDAGVPEARTLYYTKKIIYGTTFAGGYNDGAVWGVSTSGIETFLTPFDSTLSLPIAGVTMLGGVFYGTVTIPGDGAVYSLVPGGTPQRLAYTPDTPASALVNVDGVLYGASLYGGTTTQCAPGHSGCGTVFSVTTAGVEKVVYAFKGGNDGNAPEALISAGGLLYGVTGFGGTGGNGTVFSMTATGNKTVLYNFTGASDAALPFSLLATGKKLYGVSLAGGSTNAACMPSGCGTVFSLDGTKETILYSFQGGTDGISPSALVEAHGIFYGTTQAGGAYGNGTVFSLSR
jgi:uncharacterized repeat protein (TIGR03803 family)